MAESLPVEWQGVRYDSGPLTIELDREASSGGELDYASRTARAEFHVSVKFPEFAGVLAGLGVDSRFTLPVKGILRSQG
ncbi:MAG: hypothetical protein ACRD96_04045, partial [Bryobacteraceae bacterium]